MIRSCILAVLLAVAPAWVAAASVEDQLQSAALLAKENKLAQAAKAYQAILAGNPEAAAALKARYQLAKVLNDLGEIDGAVAAYAAVAEGDARFPQRREALFELAKLHAANKEHAKAVTVIERLLSEGAGLYEDDAQLLAAGWYAVQSKWDEAGAKLNLLKRKRESKLAKEAAYRMVVLWLRAGRIDDATAALGDFVRTFGDDERLPDLFIRAVTLSKERNRIDQALAIAAQLKTAYPRSPEAAAADYVAAVIQYERKDAAGAIRILDAIGRNDRPQLRPVAGEALLLSAQIHLFDLKDEAAAMDRYRAAADRVRESDAPRKVEILEQANYHLAEHHFRAKRWAVALEHYLVLRQIGSTLNVFGRILECQKELGEDPRLDGVLGEADIARFKDIVDRHPRTEAAVEAELQILQIRVGNARRGGDSIRRFAADFERILKDYPAEVVARNDNAMYCHLQIGLCLSAGKDAADRTAALAAFERALALCPPTGSYRPDILDGIARMAEATGDRARARATYAELARLVGDQAGAAAKAEKPDQRRVAELRQRSDGYLAALVARSDAGSAAEVEKLLLQIIEQVGPLSDQAREARFQLGEVRIAARDFPGAAKAFTEFIAVYGPKQDAAGDFAERFRPDDRPETAQLMRAAARRAQAWSLNRHTQHQLAAYRWIDRNLPERNRWLPEARYHLAMALVAGTRAAQREAKLEAAKALWAGLYSREADPAKAAQARHDWVGSNDPVIVPYVKTGLLKAGQFFGEAEDHLMAAACFQAVVDRYARNPDQLNDEDRALYLADDQIPVARYALGLACIRIGDRSRLLAAWRPYIDELRADRFRIPALRQFGAIMLQADDQAPAIDALSVLLDEYGTNPIDAAGKPLPVPEQERLRGRTAWNGVRMPRPASLDQGQIRYQLGFLHFSRDQVTRAAKVLAPFLSDEALKANPSRDRALFMLGQSRLRARDAAGADAALDALLSDHPRFAAAEEAYTWLARARLEAGRHEPLARLMREYAKAYPAGERRPRMDLIAAQGQVAQGKAAEGQTALTAVFQGALYQDVKADAAAAIAGVHLAAKPPQLDRAREWFDRSLGILPTAPALLGAARTAAAQRRHQDARTLAERLLQDFPRADPDLAAAARDAIVAAQKELAKGQPAK